MDNFTTRPPSLVKSNVKQSFRWRMKSLLDCRRGEYQSENCALFDSKIALHLSLDSRKVSTLRPGATGHSRPQTTLIRHNDQFSYTF